MTFVIIFCLLAYSIILHEIAHGAVARLHGDPTAQRAGRLTLNPIPHIDPVGTILLPLILVATNSGIFFAWAKPVPFDPSYFKNKAWGIFATGVAGPLTNVLLACVFAAALRLTGGETPYAVFLYYGTYVNVILAVFNLLPIPPLDGSKAVGVLLPKAAKKVYDSLEIWGLFILLILLYTGVLGKLILPVQRQLMQALLG